MLTIEKAQRLLDFLGFFYRLQDHYIFDFYKALFEHFDEITASCLMPDFSSLTCPKALSSQRL